MEKESFSKRFLAVKAEVQKYEVAVEVYQQRLREKVDALVIAHANMLQELQAITDEQFREEVLRTIPAELEINRIEDLEYLKSLKSSYDTVVNEAERAGNAALNQ